MLSKPFTDLQQWIQYFADQPTPILAHTQVEMRGYHERIDEIGLHEISALIRHDPLLTLNILRYQEEHRHTRQTTDVTTMNTGKPRASPSCASLPSSRAVGTNSRFSRKNMTIASSGKITT